MELSKNRLLNMYETMENIRNFDLKVNQIVKRGMVPGMTHLSVGEEAANVGAMTALNPDDLITSNHRGHGQVIAKGVNLNEMMAEIMGKATGICKGKGGSMHIADLENEFGSKRNCWRRTWNSSRSRIHTESEEDR